MAIPQKQTEHNYSFLFAGICGISLLAWLINSYAPTLWMMVIFFLFLFVTTMSIAFFLLHRLRWSLLSASGITGMAFLRAIGLRELLYPVLIVACLVSLELYLNKR